VPVELEDSEPPLEDPSLVVERAGSSPVLDEGSVVGAPLVVLSTDSAGSEEQAHSNKRPAERLEVEWLMVSTRYLMRPLSLLVK